MKWIADNLRERVVGVILLFKGWQAIPAAILIIYLLAGLFAPPEMPPPRFPIVPESRDYYALISPFGGGPPDGEMQILGSDRLGRDILQSILFVSSRVERFAIPASLLGVAVGFAAAWALSRTPRYAKYAACAALAVAFVPAIALAYSAEIKTGLYHIFSPLPNSSMGEHAVKLLIPATVSAAGTFSIMAFKRSRDSVDQAHSIPHLGWAGVCLFASLSLTILAIWQAPSVYGFETGDVSPFFHCVDHSVQPVILAVGVGCSTYSNYLMEWHVWLPITAVLMALASSVLLALWSASVLFRRSGSVPASARSSQVMPGWVRSGWRTFLVVLFAAVAAVFIGVFTPAVLAGAVGGVTLMVLVSSRSRVGVYVFNGIVSAAIAACSIMLLIVLSDVFKRCSPSSFSRPGCADRVIDFDLAGSAWWPGIFLAFLAVSLVLLVSLTVLPMLRSRRSGRVLSVMLTAVMGWGVLVLLITFVQSVWWPYVGSIVVAARFLYISPQPVPQVHVLTAALAMLVLAVFISRYRDTRSACNLIVWGGIGSLLVITLGMSNPDIEVLLFSSDPLEFYGEGGRLIRDFLLAFVVGYGWLSFVGISSSSAHGVEDNGSGRFRRGLRSVGVVLGVGVASACVTYAAASVVLYDDNFARSLELFGVGSDGYPEGRWGLWLRLWAYGLEVCAVAATGIYLCARCRRVRGRMHMPVGC